jgi:hypothetical protein
VTTAPADARWIVPELGPSLGRLVDPPVSRGAAPDVPVDDIRLALVTGIFDLAGAARSFAAAGDQQGTVASLGRVAWLQLWEKAVASTAARIGAEANNGLRRAAAESRFPRRRLERLLLDDQEVRAIAARLGSGGGPFVAALDALEQAGHGSGPGARAEAAARWREALGAAARRLESAWLALEQAARVEQESWAAEIALVRAWHRPRWPLWAITALVIAAAAYVGLVLGGYLPAHGWLRGLAAFWWARG